MPNNCNIGSIYSHLREAFVWKAIEISQYVLNRVHDERMVFIYFRQCVNDVNATVCLFFLVSFKIKIGCKIYEMHQSPDKSREISSIWIFILHSKFFCELLWQCVYVLDIYNTSQCNAVVQCSAHITQIERIIKSIRCLCGRTKAFVVSFDSVAKPVSLINCEAMTAITYNIT